MSSARLPPVSGRASSVAFSHRSESSRGGMQYHEEPTEGGYEA